MNTDTNILNKVTAKQVHQLIKVIKHHGQVRFIPGMQSWFSTCKSITVIRKGVSPQTRIIFWRAGPL